MLVRLLLLFTVVPLVELVILVQLGRHVGLPATLALVLGTGVLGAGLARWQGLRAAREVMGQLSAGRLPAVALLEGLLILMAGVFLVTPGLLTDLAGFALLVPPIRRAILRGLEERIRRRLHGDGPVVLDATFRRE